MPIIEVKTCINLTRNVYLKFEQGTRYKISERQFLEFPEEAKMVYFQGNFNKTDCIDKVNELVNEFKLSNNYKVIINGKDVTSDF